jgi:Tfp pilus assembly protein PilN
MDIIELIARKQQEADALSQDITLMQSNRDARLEVIDRLNQLQLQSQFSKEDVSFYLEELRK